MAKEGGNSVDWKAYYDGRTMTGAAAMKAIKSGERIFIGSNSAEPQALVGALTTSADHIEHAEIVHIMTLGPAPM